MNTCARTTPAAGFALLEVLVTLVVVLVGLLGAAGVLVFSHQSSVEAYQRTQALILIEDMVDRISANRHVADCYAVTNAGSGTPYLGTGDKSTPACGSGTPEQQATAISDLHQWSGPRAGATESDAAGSTVGSMVGARGCIALNAATKEYTLTVAWQGLTETAAPPAAIRCAAGLYGSEAPGEGEEGWLQDRTPGRRCLAERPDRPPHARESPQSGGWP